MQLWSFKGVIETMWENSYFIYSVISTILFVAVPLIFIYIQVSDSGSQEPLVNISVIMTYNLEQVIFSVSDA